MKVGRKNAKRQKENFISSGGKGRQGKPSSPRVNVQMNKKRAPKSLKVEPLVKEEGEMSDNEEVYEQFKEVKWMEWCEDVMIDEEKTLKRLQKLQSTSADLPKEKVDLSISCHISIALVFLIVLNFAPKLLPCQVLSKIRNYLQLIGRRIDQIVSEYEQESYRQESMCFIYMSNQIFYVVARLAFLLRTRCLH